MGLKKVVWTINKKDLNISTLYHLYNCMAVYALISEVGVDITHYNNIVSLYFGNLGKWKKLMILINELKSHRSFNEVPRIIKNDNSKKTILFMLNY